MSPAGGALPGQTIGAMRAGCWAETGLLISTMAGVAALLAYLGRQDAAIGHSSAR